MSKQGRNRKGLGYQSKSQRKIPWHPIEASHEVRYQIIKRKSNAGVEYTTYKPVILPKR